VVRDSLSWLVRQLSSLWVEIDVSDYPDPKVEGSKLFRNVATASHPAIPQPQQAPLPNY